MRGRYPGDLIIRLPFLQPQQGWLFRAAPPDGRHAVGRRAADAGDRPRLDVGAAPHPDGRAVDGAGALVVKEIVSTIRVLRQDGATIVLVEQMAAVALRLADRAYVLENGLVKLSGTGAELARTPEVKRAYLGG